MGVDDNKCSFKHKQMLDQMITFATLRSRQPEEIEHQHFLKRLNEKMAVACELPVELLSFEDGTITKVATALSKFEDKAMVKIRSINEILGITPPVVTNELAYPNMFILDSLAGLYYKPTRNKRYKYYRTQLFYSKRRR